MRQTCVVVRCTSSHTPSSELFLTWKAFVDLVPRPATTSFSTPSSTSLTITVKDVRAVRPKTGISSTTVYEYGSAFFATLTTSGLTLKKRSGSPCRKLRTASGEARSFLVASWMWVRKNGHIAILVIAISNSMS